MIALAVASHAARLSPLRGTVDAFATPRRAWRVRKDEGRDIESFLSRRIEAGVLVQPEAIRLSADAGGTVRDMLERRGEL